MITHTARRPTRSFDWLADDCWHLTVERRAAERERFEGLPRSVEHEDSEELAEPSEALEHTHDLERQRDPLAQKRCAKCRASEMWSRRNRCPDYKTVEEMLSEFLTAFSAWIEAGCPIEKERA
jgi:hypothetical protein